MTQVVRILDMRGRDPIFTVRELLWELVEKDIVHALLVSLQANPGEAPTPTLIKCREHLGKANPLAPVMTLNSAKIAGLFLAQESGKALAAVVRPCEARALAELTKRRIPSQHLITVSIDCLGSFDGDDFEQRAAVWGEGALTQESLRWSRRGQIAPYRFRRACQACEQPFHDQADIVVGLLGQNVREKMLVLIKASLAEQIGWIEKGWVAPSAEEDLARRRKAIDGLVAQRHLTRRRFVAEIRETIGELKDLLALFGLCTLCGECQEACPLTLVSDFDLDAYEENAPAYVTARLLEIAARSESCAGCGMCEAACPAGLPLMFVSQMIAEQPMLKRGIMAISAGQISGSC